MAESTDKLGSETRGKSGGHVGIFSRKFEKKISFSLFIQTKERISTILALLCWDKLQIVLSKREMNETQIGFDKNNIHNKNTKNLYDP